MNNELQELIEAYFAEDELSHEQKAHAEKRLLLQCPQQFLDRREKEALIDQLFSEIDISDEAMQTIKNSQQT